LFIFIDSTPWPLDYQELTPLSRFANGTFQESEAKVGHFHFLSLTVICAQTPECFALVKYFMLSYDRILQNKQILPLKTCHGNSSGLKEVDVCCCVFEST